MGTVQSHLAIRCALCEFSPGLKSRVSYHTEGHFATLTTAMDQSSDHTKVTWTLSGVPVGMEDEINRNLNGY